MNGYRIGIVGCGGIAHRHIAGYRKVAHDLGEVVAGCDIDKEQLNGYCDQYDIPNRFTNAADMIASGEVDVISLLTPPAVRHDVIFPAIEKGIHLLVEKPFGETLCDAVSFVEAAEKSRRNPGGKPSIGIHGRHRRNARYHQLGRNWRHTLYITRRTKKSDAGTRVAKPGAAPGNQYL